MRESESAAVDFFRLSPHLGKYAAEILIEDDADVEYGATFKKGHITLWGDPSYLLARVVRVVRLDTPKPQQANEASIVYSIGMVDSVASARPLLPVGVAYELWDVEGQGVCWATSTEGEAVSVVADWLQRFGSSYVESLLLIRYDEDGHPSYVSEGLGILTRTQATDGS